MSLLPVSTKGNKYDDKPTSHNIHPAFYVAISWVHHDEIEASWKSLRSHAAMLLTCYHLTFATVTTQILARFSTVLDGRHLVRMTPKLYVRAIVPIGVFYSLSLVCSNLPYLYLSVAFIQMLKVPQTPDPDTSQLGRADNRIQGATVGTSVNLLVIVLGVMLASLGEIKFQITGFLFQVGGLVFEAYRLALIQKLLNDEKYKMDPLVSLYYFAPCCTGMIALMGMADEWRSIRWEDLQAVGWWVWAANGIVAMGLNVAGVSLIGKTSSLVLTLCGVAKSISLIGASMAIWGTVVTPIQFLGNGIAMAGLVYYNIGGEKVQAMAAGAQAQCSGFWQQRSTGGKMVLAVGLVMLALGVVGGVAVGCGGRMDLKDFWTVGAVH
ncbi:MAG: hypothetical protein LQ345_006955 [Seirophora villosa]|nr:MAG: hypothetical protein LQ345_006955 [Seirophora villosa]